ncbi:CNNM domain-containing protein [Hathewaya histolytica]|uniref:CNNM domain-containing protein n=1 Tax=Hathewaya histolytica TaxID=1498 RepID=UPI003B67B78F
MEESNKKKNKKKGKSFSQKKWIITIFIWTILLGGSISLLSDSLLGNSSLLVAFILLTLIILIGIFFDAIGTAVTSASEVPFHAMASKKISGAKTAVSLIRNADKVANFCNDVIGDICGIVSGSAGAIITKKFMESLTPKENVLSVILPAIIGALTAAFTIGGKALGKNYAIKNSNNIIFNVAKFIQFFKKER